MRASSSKAVAPDDPFLFFGQGFGTSERCLEGFLWHVHPPDARARARIVARLPFAVSSFARFDGELLHFGSNDDLEERVSSAHHPDHIGLDPKEVLQRISDLPAPERREWKAFNCAFERAVQEIHQDDPLVAVIKPDDGVYGRTLGRWHRRSVARAHELAKRASQRSAPPKGSWSAMAMNLLEDVLPTAGKVRKLRDADFPPWIAWLDRLVASGDRQLRDAFAERLSWMLDAIEHKSHVKALIALSVSTRRLVRALPPSTSTGPSVTHHSPARTTTNGSKRPTMASKTTKNSAAKKAAKKKTPSKSTLGESVKMMRAAINEVVIPVLRDEGFEGSYPNFRRIANKQTHVMWFSLDKDVNGSVQVEIATVARRTDTSVKDDYHRAIDIRNRKRKVLTELVPAADAALFWYEDAAVRWGVDWPNELAALLLRLLQEHAERYFGKLHERL